MSELAQARALPDPIDWATARRVANVVAGRDAIASSYLGDSLAADFAEVSVQAESLVSEHTGLFAPTPAAAAVLDRRGWVDANLDSMRRMLSPLTERLGERFGNRPLAGVGRHVAGSEIGFLLGYVAQRVLGQYDLLVPDDDGEGDMVYYVGPNVLALEKRFAFRPIEFRRWIAIHELTHRAQFCGVPWLRSYFLELVDGLLGTVEPDPKAIVTALRRAGEEVRAGRNPMSGHGVVGLVATPEQRELIARVQALMTLLEGHGNAVMAQVGSAHVLGADRMAAVLNNRRRPRGIGAVMSKLLGLEMKLRQYEVGERFVREVETIAGPRAIDRAWLEPAALPSLDEFSDASGWLARVDGASVATSNAGARVR